MDKALNYNPQAADSVVAKLSPADRECVVFCQQTFVPLPKELAIKLAALVSIRNKA